MMDYKNKIYVIPQTRNYSNIYGMLAKNLSKNKPEELPYDYLMKTVKKIVITNKNNQQKYNGP